MAIIDGGREDIPQEGIVLVDLWATWCGPCKMMSSRLDDFSKLQPDITILKVDVDKNPDVASEFEIMSIPTLILLKDGKEVGRKIGIQDVDSLKGFVDIKI